MGNNLRVRKKLKAYANAYDSCQGFPGKPAVYLEYSHYDKGDISRYNYVSDINMIQFVDKQRNTRYTAVEEAVGHQEALEGKPANQNSRNDISQVLYAGQQAIVIGFH